MDSATRALETLQEDVVPDGGTMAVPAQLSLTQSSSGTPSCGKCYRQGDQAPRSNTGKIWDLAYPEGKGVLSKGQLFIALCLVHAPRMHCRYSEELERGCSSTNTSPHP
ncbi:hypothetical protein QTO34_009927 [Cnephaeus nilssonii]|uniref:Uncharacterized protein n=1 Tax=Cnephaeus nilssonii TaxID=3371016 RepID=A0AA40LFC3_CNENI|nr:hypothetical protein QTO34_009927 [Eptesicus nilssonii]